MDGNEFLEQIITGVETWVYFCLPEFKHASKAWKKMKEALWKYNEIPSVGKVLRMVFWDCRRIPIVEYLPQGINPGTEKKYTANQRQYFDTILHLRDVIKSKRLGSSKKVMLIHDNAQPNTAELIAALITSLKWDTFPHLAYSPDLSPFNF